MGGTLEADEVIYSFQKGIALIVEFCKMVRPTERGVIRDRTARQLNVEEHVFNVSKPTLASAQI
jgi:hypothetical protein